MITIFSFLTTIIFFFYLASGAPLLNVNNDQKLMNGQAFYKSFNLFDLPLVGNRQPPKMEDVSSVSNHQVNADLAVVSSAEADPSGPEPFTGYGEAVETPRTDMFLINAPGDGQEQHRETEFKPIGVVPKLTGKILAPLQKHQLPADKNEAAVINPTAYFLEGADLDKVEKPKCRLIGCDGPIVEEDVYLDQGSTGEGPDKCYQVFVPIVDAQVRVGMICRVCCESSALLKELKKTRLQIDN